VITANKECYWYLYVTGYTQELSVKRGDIIHQMIEHIWFYVTFSNIMASMLIIHRFLNFSQKRGEAKYSSLNCVCSTLMVILYKPELKNEWSKLSVRKMSMNNWMLDILRWSINLWWLPQRKNMRSMTFDTNCAPLLTDLFIIHMILTAHSGFSRKLEIR
jgi:hypothetical protein